MPKAYNGTIRFKIKLWTRHRVQQPHSYPLHQEINYYYYYYYYYNI